MKDNIIILKDIRGEYNDDSQEYIVGVYLIDKSVNLHQDFCEYLKKFYEDNGLEALIMGSKDEPYVSLRFMQYEYRKEYKGRFKELNKKLTELYKANKKYQSIQYYVEEILKLKRIEVQEYYV